MAKHCETFDHTADVGLAARADTLGELMEALAEGLSDVICHRTSISPAERRRIAVEAEDVEALAVDFLSAALAAIQVDRFLVATVRLHRADEQAVCGEHVVEGVLVGESYEPPRHEIRTEIKAVTYHELKVAREGDEWVARVILDL